jgi:hypothetical protein
MNNLFKWIKERQREREMRRLPWIKRYKFKYKVELYGWVYASNYDQSRSDEIYTLPYISIRKRQCIANKKQIIFCRYIFFFYFYCDRDWHEAYVTCASSAQHKVAQQISRDDYFTCILRQWCNLKVNYCNIFRVDDHISYTNIYL